MCVLYYVFDYNMNQILNIMSEFKMSRQQFHVENWVEYYKAELDDDNLKNIIDEYYEGTLLSYYVSDDVLETSVSSQLYDYYVSEVYLNEETYEEIDAEFEIDAIINYETNYQMLFNEVDFDKCQEALNNALESGESTFVVEVEADVTFASIFNIDVTAYREHEELDADETYQLIEKSIERDFLESRYNASASNTLQRPSDKILRFVCTIPSN